VGAYYLKKQLFDLEVNSQGHAKVIVVRDTLTYDHAPTYQITLTYLERQKCYDNNCFLNSISLSGP
jgi:hypothetical protein